MKKAIVIVSFGTSVDSARVHLSGAEQYLGAMYADADYYHAYTSGFIRKKLARSGEKVASPEEILLYLHDQEYTDVILRPTHMIPGQEYDRLQELTEKFEELFGSLILRKPLIHDAESLLKAAETVYGASLRSYRDDYGCEPEDRIAFLFMGHGTEHLSNFIYPAMQTAFATLGITDAYVATVEGWPSLEDVIRVLKQNGVGKVCLAPLMLVAGEHFMNDMVGEHAESWKNILKAEGFLVCHIGKGLCEYQEVMDLYQ